MRPSNFTEEVLALAEDYRDNYKDKYGDLIPTVVGLCLAIKRSKSIVYDWIKHEDKVEFSDIVCEIQEIQERGLINGSLSKEFEPRTSQMLLAKHGYFEALKSDHTSSDGSMTPKVIERRIIDVANDTTD